MGKRNGVSLDCQESSDFHRPPHSSRSGEARGDGASLPWRKADGKSSGEDLPSRAARFIDQLGHNKVTLRCDNEPSIEALAREIGQARQEGSQIVPERPSVGESQSNGMIELALGLVAGRIRAKKLAKREARPSWRDHQWWKASQMGSSNVDSWLVRPEH